MHQTYTLTYSISFSQYLSSKSSDNQLVPTLIATSSIDKQVKLWDISNNKATLIASRSMEVGKLYTLSFDAMNVVVNDIKNMNEETALELQHETPFLLVCGGDKGELALWDTTENKNIQRHYKQYIELTKHRTIKHEDEDERKIRQSTLSTAADRRKAAKAAKRQAKNHHSDSSSDDDSHSDDMEHDDDMHMDEQ
jgi:WD40 repeat protein